MKLAPVAGRKFNRKLKINTFKAWSARNCYACSVFDCIMWNQSIQFSSVHAANRCTSVITVAFSKQFNIF